MVGVGARTEVETDIAFPPLFFFPFFPIGITFLGGIIVQAAAATEVLDASTFTVLDATTASPSLLLISSQTRTEFS